MTGAENREAAFLAKITASTTHEIRNVLAIVKESAGLIDDLVRSFGKRGTLKEDKLFQAVGRIDAQVGRGAQLLTNLNRLAHGLDRASEPVDLGASAQQVASLSERFARQRRQTVQVRAPEAPLTATANALQLQMVLFAAVECCLEAMAEGGAVTIQPHQFGGLPAVKVVGEIDSAPAPSDPTATAAWPRLATLGEDLNASVQVVEGSCTIHVVFSVPERR
jgi:C4-dicarboxylate-specific signal transduction histidine kinase